MSQREDVSRREKWYVTNNTDKIITIGDLITVPEFGPRKTIDILRFANKDKISGSKVLVKLIRDGTFSLRKVVDSDTPKTQVTQENVQDALISIERTDSSLGDGSGSGLSGTSGFSGISGISGTSGISGISGISGAGSIAPSSSTFIRGDDGSIEEVNYVNGRNILINRNLSGQVTSVVDNFKGTYTINRDINGVITGVSFS